MKKWLDDLRWKVNELYFSMVMLSIMITNRIKYWINEKSANKRDRRSN